MKYLILLAGCLIALVGCQAERSTKSFFGPDASHILVVDALLIVDKPLPDLFVHETADALQPYNRSEMGVTDAEVVIAQGEQMFAYRADPNFAGRYLPPSNAPLVLPRTVYDLSVRSQGRAAQARTETPDKLDIREIALLDDATREVIRVLKKYKDGTVFLASENQIPYQLGLLEVRFDPLPVIGYQFSVESLDETSNSVLLGDGDHLLRHINSPVFEAKDGHVRLPWFTVGWAGPHVMRVYAVDANWFDLIRSSPRMVDDIGEFSATSGRLAGDNFERPLFRVEGGIGLFGSASVDSVGFVVLPHTLQ